MRPSQYKKLKVLRQIRDNYPSLPKVEIAPVLDIRKSKLEAKDKRDEKKYRNILSKYAKRCGKVERYFDPSVIRDNCPSLV